MSGFLLKRIYEYMHKLRRYIKRYFAVLLLAVLRCMHDSVYYYRYNIKIGFQIITFITVYRRYLIYVVIKPVGIHGIGMGSPCQIRTILSTVCRIIIYRKINGNSFTDISLYSGLMIPCHTRMPHDEELFTVLCHYNKYKASSDSARMVSSSCFNISSFNTVVCGMGYRIYHQILDKRSSAF